MGISLTFRPAWSQGPWSDEKRPGSADISALAPVSSGLLAGSVSGRVFHSTDGGKTWSQGNLRAGAPIAGFLETGTVLLAWAGVVKNPLADCFEFFCVDVTLPGGLFRSSDGGKAWNRVGPDHGVTAVSRAGNALYANGRYDLFRSTDGGLTWAKLTTVGGTQGMDRMEVLGTTVVGSAYGFGSVGTLGGDTIRWDNSSSSGAVSTLFTNFRGYLYAERQGESPAFAIGLKRTRDGRTWESIANRRFQRMVASGDRLVGLGQDTVLESRDEGRSWTVVATGFLESQLHRTLAETGGTIFIGGSTRKGVLALEADGRRGWLNEGMYDAPPGPIYLKNWHILVGDPNRMLMTRSLVYGPRDWREVSVDGRPAGASHFGSLGGTVWAASQGSGYRSDDFGRDPRLGPQAWSMDSLVASRGSATGRGWTAFFAGGRRIVICAGPAPITCRDGDTQALPEETFNTNPFGTTVRYNRFRAMTASGDSLAILLDSLYLSPDRGRSFRNLGVPDPAPAWIGFHHGRLYAGRAAAPADRESGLLRLDPATGRWEDFPLTGVRSGARVQAMASEESGLLIATSEGVYWNKAADGAWIDLSEGLPARNAVGIAYEQSAMAVALEAGQLMTRFLYPVGLRPEARPGKPSAPRRAGGNPAFAAPDGAWRRLDGRTVTRPLH